MGHTALPFKNIALLVELIREAHEAGAKLLVCPELYISGYNISFEQTYGLAEVATGPAYQAVKDAAKRFSVAVIYGFAERSKGPVGTLDTVYNSANVVGADGLLLQTYRKCHLWGSREKAIFKPGDRLGPVVQLAGWSVGVLICYDVEIPEAVRTLRHKGAELICVPTANAAYPQVNRTLVRARAMENHVFVAYSNHSGEENGMAFCGESVVCAPDGEMLLHLDQQQNGLAFVSLDRSLLDPPQDYNYLEDLKPELYSDAGCLTKWLKTQTVPVAISVIGVCGILFSQWNKFNRLRK